MKILLLGSGGREHAFAWKIAQSPICSDLFIAPGNAGTKDCGTNVNLNVSDFEGIKNFVVKKDVDMVVVGPEAPLVEGIYDYFGSDEELRLVSVIGPSKKGAQLEGSKEYAKEFMIRHDIPTAVYRSFSQGTLDEGKQFIDSLTEPIVLKADGLAAGKGVLICSNKDEAKQELQEMLEGKFGNASNKVVIEEFLDGIELSVFVITDGTSYKILPASKDYKRIGEGDKGLNTGGMGAVSPVPFADESFMNKVEDRIIKPTIEGFKKDEIVYNGFVYFGLMNVNGEPWVIEYNVRLGDPETQVVMPRLKSDLVELFEATSNGTLNDCLIEIDERAATTIVLASGGYPGSYEKGKTITNVNIKNGIVFHAGTKIDGDNLVTSGGRVLAVTSFGDNIEDALDASNKNADAIQFDGKYYRKDIGFDLVKESSIS
ncbi:MAG: phosphoribosylamine--glycine ligase [Bacteroidetes bacterium]|nr:MAG: phosphoribosylamine--glycine ligase [Bacteroidota bacterium]